MKKTDTNLKKLNSVLQKGAVLSIDDICELLKVNRSRAYEYLSLLQEYGLSICTERNGHKAYYHLNVEACPNDCYYPVSKSDVFKFQILSLLCQKKSTAHELYKNYFEQYIPLSSFYYTINDMIKSDLIRIDINPTDNTIQDITSSSVLYTRRELSPTGTNASLILNLNLNAHQYINASVASGQYQSSALNSLGLKLTYLLGDNTLIPEDNLLFYQYGRGYHMDQKIHEYYTLLMNNHFQSKILELDYHGKHILFSSGMLVYSQDKDMLYLLGRISRTHNASILKLSDALNITCTDCDNHEYGLQKYNNYLQDMFSISLDKPEFVEVIFDNTPRNIFRLERLCKLRVNSSLLRKDNHLIYKDTISGLNDFAAYLRTYGTNYRIIQPLKLNDILKKSLERTLSRYKDI